MELEELFKTAKTDTREHFKQKLSSLIRNDYKYRNLNEDNQKLIMDIIYKHIDAIRDGRGVSGYVLEKETYKLHSNREKYNLTLQDLEDVKEILNLFKQ